MGWNDHVEKKKPNKKANDATKRYSDVKFLNVDLSADDKSRLKGMDYTSSDMENHLEKHCEEYKITLKWDSFSSACAAFMSPLESDHINAKYVLTGRGSSILKAFKQLMFIHEILSPEGDWSVWDKQKVYDIDD